MPLSAGDKLGPDEILAPLGAGGMGEVYKARDTRLDRIVAVKVSRQEFTERFEREARVVAALNHPHICQLYDVGPDYLVMECVEGLTLKGPLPLDKALEYAGQIASALDTAHTNGVTHRDLKPANILVTKSAGVKLLDFGLAKIDKPVTVDDGTLSMELTAKGTILGTLRYMSPEQVNGGEAGPRSDIFSFGLVLYEMITGKRAFEGGTPASVIKCNPGAPGPICSRCGAPGFRPPAQALPGERPGKSLANGARPARSAGACRADRRANRCASAATGAAGLARRGNGDAGPWSARLPPLPRSTAA
jgi:serine/threonine protein kinase